MQRPFPEIKPALSNLEAITEEKVRFVPLTKAKEISPFHKLRQA
ncbi:hypothetical protein NWP26_05145 [Chrysosporum ovalisporum APH033B]|uniref:Uncharacterized protein n=1 Tax=Umezakia ovalisporum FSS-62 TaxID=2971776 RepID=A0AA43KFK4_9CYAN|nr:hypothetical protein [Umezakia ovalisporum]MDH6064662.1 hypothetical protein [Umezakia ovalisporum FSS-62]MDH6066658.1 hypothetical protein [Umezakia ovalisporum APH033B]MDH6071590.1 hypothetical protein [Umezakia ovalisporum CobakiLakeA]MDH6073048.1 hypothetical protein [Umezakia ovalisporum CS-1034]MDH6080930.1 hypothetical protein [Umezakia ovalisporum FSS-44]